MDKFNSDMIKTLMVKADKESEKISQLYYYKNYAKELTKNELLKCKIIYTTTELDFVINNYVKQNTNNELLKCCIYLLDKYKQTNQTSKCDAIYQILNKYFTIINCYSQYNYHDDVSEEWIGFSMNTFIKCPEELEEMIKEKAVQLKSKDQEKSRTKYKEKADITDKKIISELEL